MDEEIVEHNSCIYKSRQEIAYVAYIVVKKSQ